jgi:2-iminobutanoate/2-iminopropanoate deaminase
MLKKVVVTAENAPKAIGPYSVAIKANGFVFASGQIGFDPATGQVVEGGVEAETRQVLKNVSAVLAAAGASLQDVVKTTVFLRDIADFGKMNEVYATFFPENPPARSAIQAGALPRNAAVEIEVVALLPEG